MRSAYETRRLYRSRDGMFLGVCRGAADYAEAPVGLVRVGVIVMTFMTGLFPGIILYIIAGLLMKPEPMVAFENDSEQEFYESYVSSRGSAAARLRQTYDTVERRLERLEGIVTSRDFDWESRLNK